MTRSGRWLWITAGVLVVLIVVAGVLALFFDLGPAGIRTATVKTENVKQTVSAPGQVQCARRATVDAAADGVVGAVLVEVGESVEEGQKLAELDTTAAKNDLEAAKAQLDAAEAAMDATTELDDQPGNAPTAALRKQRMAEVARSEALVESAESVVEAGALFAPMAGTVTAVNYEVGDRVVAGSPATAASVGDDRSPTDCSIGRQPTGFLEIADLSEMRLVAQFTGEDIAKVKVDQQGKGTLWAFPGHSLDTHVGGIAPTAHTTPQGPRFEVVLPVEQVPDGAKPGHAGRITVTTAEVRDVVSVPREAVRVAGIRGSVTVLRDGEKVERPVWIGLVGDDKVQVTSGLHPGEVVVLPDRG